jgi:exopolyphosphatase/guanosine-5'-triphosphate,3'-diphosphate pyrophosphatase
VAEYNTIAAVDLGSNSFHCQIARLDGDHTYPLDSLREAVRLAEGLDDNKVLDEASQARAIACLQRFGERLRSFHADNVRALGTNTLRVAKNAPVFLKKAQAALGFPIEIIAGREEARLIYAGVSHSLPPSSEQRLVVDIGGGSTELIIGEGYKPQRLDSLYMGCVTYSQRFFRNGDLTKRAFKEAELAARAELQHLVSDFEHGNWAYAVGSSGTARALAQVLQLSGYSDAGITAEGLAQLRAQCLKWGNISRIAVDGLREDRKPVLPGGLAIMSAVFDELDITHMSAAEGALREGIIIDMVGRSHHHDPRETTVAQFMQRYHVDEVQARRVAQLAASLHQRLTERDNVDTHDLNWAARLHEIGISVAYSGYHKHSAYIAANADMPGFTREEQNHIAGLLLTHRRSLKKISLETEAMLDWTKVFALRLAVLFCQRRTHNNPRILSAKAGDRKFRLSLDPAWLARNPLTNAVLHAEVSEWEKIGFEVKISGLYGIGDGAEGEAAGIPQPKAGYPGS